MTVDSEQLVKDPNDLASPFDVIKLHALCVLAAIGAVLCTENEDEISVAHKNRCRWGITLFMSVLNVIYIAQ